MAEPKKRGRPRKVIEEPLPPPPQPPELKRARRKKLPDERLEEADVSFKSARGDVSFKGRKPKKAEAVAEQSAQPEPAQEQPGKYSALHHEGPSMFWV